METIVAIASATLVLLEVAGAVTQKTQKFLPIGGSHIAQMAIVFGVAFAILEIMSALHT
jgi:hypothetical protein